MTDAAQHEAPALASLASVPPVASNAADVADATDASDAGAECLRCGYSPIPPSALSCPRCTSYCWDVAPRRHSILSASGPRPSPTRERIHVRIAGQRRWVETPERLTRRELDELDQLTVRQATRRRAQALLWRELGWDVTEPDARILARVQEVKAQAKAFMEERWRAQEAAALRADLPAPASTSEHVGTATTAKSVEYPPVQSPGRSALPPPPRLSDRFADSRRAAPPLPPPPRMPEPARMPEQPERMATRVATLDDVTRITLDNLSPQAVAPAPAPAMPLPAPDVAWEAERHEEIERGGGDGLQT